MVAVWFRVFEAVGAGVGDAGAGPGGVVFGGGGAADYATVDEVDAWCGLRDEIVDCAG